MSVVTVVVDASFCPTHRVGGWAAWIKTDGRPGVFVGGPLKGLCGSAGDAEAKAAVNAVFAIVIGGMAGPSDRIVLKSDCLEALGALRGGNVRLTRDSPAQSRKVRVRHAATAAILHGLLESRGVTVDLRHVKGHSHSQGGNSWANRECDRIAKSHMRQLRETIENGAYGVAV
jgi:ribonuclease HI